MKYIVWIVIGVLGYTAWTYVPAFMTRSEISRHIETVLDGVPHHASDEMIHKRLIRTAKTTALELSADQILVSRTESQGQRGILVAVAAPVMVSYFGSEQQVGGPVEVERRFGVDEAAESRRLSAIRDKEEFRERSQRKLERFNERLLDVWNECEGKFGKGNCKRDVAPKGTPDGTILKSWE